MLSSQSFVQYTRNLHLNASGALSGDISTSAFSNVRPTSTPVSIISDSAALSKSDFFGIGERFRRSFSKNTSAKPNRTSGMYGDAAGKILRAGPTIKA